MALEELERLDVPVQLPCLCWSFDSPLGFDVQLPDQCMISWSKCTSHQPHAFDNFLELLLKEANLSSLPTSQTQQPFLWDCCPEQFGLPKHHYLFNRLPKHRKGCVPATSGSLARARCQVVASSPSVSRHFHEHVGLSIVAHTNVPCSLASILPYFLTWGWINTYYTILGVLNSYLPAMYIHICMYILYMYNYVYTFCIHIWVYSYCIYIYTHHIYIFYKMYIHMHIILCLYMVFKTQCDELSIFAVGHWWGPDGFHLSEDGRVLKDWKYFFVCAKTEHLLFA